MALPQQVIDRLSHDETRTPGLFSGLLFFSVIIAFIVVVIYFGITIGYEPYLNSQITNLNSQINTASTTVPAADQAALVDFYSQLFNIQLLLKNHVVFTPFFTWLETNTGANVYYSQADLSSSGKATLTVVAKTQDDLNQQIAVFESSSDVARVAVTSIAPLKVGANVWQSADVTLFMNTSILSGNAT